MNTIRLRWNGLNLEARSLEELSFLKKNLTKIQDELGFIINPAWLKTVKAGRTDKNTLGIFYPKSKSLKIDPNKTDKNSELDTSLLFIHEYIHAIDHANGYSITKLFLPLYIKALDLMFKMTKNQDFKLKKRGKINYSDPNKFLSLLPKNPHKIINGSYDSILFKLGYGYDYCLSNPEEFAAVTMELFFYMPSLLNEELTALCKEIKTKFFL